MEDLDGFADIPETVATTVKAATVSVPLQPIDIRPALAIIAIVFVSSLAVEFISWLVVYRTAGYQRLVREVEDQYRQYARLRQVAGNDKDLPRKRKRLDDAMMKSAREFASVRMKTGVVTVVLLFAIYRYVTNQWKGMVVARLPFYPPGFMTRLTHSSLEGDDLLDCSALFIYVLCGLAVRSNVAKFLNLGPSRAVSAIMAPQNVLDKEKYN